MAFIQANESDAKMLSDWYSRNRFAIREFHAKDKGAALAIRKRLDAVMNAAQERAAAGEAHAQELPA